MNNPFSFVKTQQSNYINKPVPQFGGGEYHQIRLIERLNAVSRGEYFEKEMAQDNVIGEFPYDDVIMWRTLLEARLTDFDTASILLEPTNETREARVSAMVVTKALFNHMRDINFWQYLNQLSFTRAFYGGALSRKDKDGTIRVESWENTISDQQDILGSPRITRYLYTPSQLMKMSDVWTDVKSVIMSATTKQDTSVDNRKQKTEHVGNQIEVFEINGEVPLSMLKTAMGEDYDDDDVFEYVEARIIVTLDDTGESDEDEGFVLFADEMSKPTHKLLLRNKISGRGLGKGVPEVLFESQKWHNFTKTEDMRMLAVAGKKLYVSDDPDVLTNIFDEGVDHGTVLRVTQGKTFTELNQVPTGLPVTQGARQEWDDSADKQISSFGAVIGEESKSGTPFRAQFLQNKAGLGQFKQYRQEIGEHHREVVEDWVLPDALKKAASDDKIYATFSPQELQLIDEVIVAKEYNEKVFEMLVTTGRAITPEEQQAVLAKIEGGMKRQGSKRAITDIKKFIRNANTKVVVHTTDEARNQEVFFESMASLVSLFAPDDPRRNAVIDKILDAVGITKEELALYQDVAPVEPQGNPGQPKIDAKALAGNKQTLNV